MKKLLQVLLLVSFTSMLPAMQKEKALPKKTKIFLETALQSGDLKSLRRALDGGVSPDRIKDEKDRTLLMDACIKGRVDFVVLLLKERANLNIQANDGATALMFACENGHSEVVKLLLSHEKIDLNTSGK